MAIAVSSIVAPKRSNGGLGIMIVPQGPVFGIVGGGSGPWDVLWNSGSLVESIPEIALDEILEAADAVQDAFVGRRVKVNTPSGQTNWGIGSCVSAYKRSGADVLLLQLPSGSFIEVFPSECSAVD